MKGALILILIFAVTYTNAIRKFNKPKKQELVVVDIKKQKSFLQKDLPQNTQLLQFSGDASMAQIDLRNINNQQYTGSLFVGTPPQEMTMQFDTGSAILYLLTDRCKSCKQDKFQIGASGSFRGTGKRESQPYGSGGVAGEIAKDQVCFDKAGTNCIEDISFIAVDKANDIGQDRFSGIAGLSPFNAEGNPNLPSFISQSGTTFSFFLSKGDGSTGKIVLGGYDVDNYAHDGAKEEDISWTQLVDESWTIPMSGLKFKGSNETMEIKSTQIMLDSGLSYSMVPQEDIQVIEIALRDQNINCKEKHHGGLDLYDCACSEEAFQNLAPLETLIGDKMVTLPPSTFMKRQDGKCTLLMYPNDVSLSVERKWVVGDLFLQNFYSIFDMKQKRIGLIPPKGASGNMMHTLPVVEEKPAKKEQEPTKKPAADTKKPSLAEKKDGDDEAEDKNEDSEKTEDKAVDRSKSENEDIAILKEKADKKQKTQEEAERNHEVLPKEDKTENSESDSKATKKEESPKDKAKKTEETDKKKDDEPEEKEKPEQKESGKKREKSILEKAGIIDDESESDEAVKEKKQKALLALNEKKTDVKDADYFSADAADPKPVSIEDAVLLKEKKQKEFEGKSWDKSKEQEDE